MKIPILPRRALTLLMSLLLIAGILAGVVAPPVTQAQTIPDSVENPDLDPGCAQDIIVILDESLSIPRPTSGSDATQAVRDAMTAAVEGLNGSGSYMAVVEFAVVARRASIGGSIDYRPVNDAYVDDFKYYIDNTAGTSTNSNNVADSTGNNGYFPGLPAPAPQDPQWNTSGTNWDDAFRRAQEIGARPGSTRKPLIIFVTDGNPNHYYSGSGNGHSGTVSETNALIPAVNRANDIRDDEIKIFAVGFGAVNQTNLIRVSGPELFDLSDPINNPPNLLTDDFFVHANAEEMATALRRAFAGLCAPSLTISKFVDGEPGGDDWQFSATVSVSEDGDFVWANPAAGLVSSPDTQSIPTSSGIAQWEWDPVDPAANSTVQFNEVQQAGYDFAGGTCVISTIEQNGTVTEGTPIVIGPDDLPYELPELTTSQYARCVINNNTPPTPTHGVIGDRIWQDNDGDSIQDGGEPGVPGIIVQLTPPSDVDLGTGFGNPVTTMTDADGNYQFTNVPPGDYIVTVLNPPPDWDLTYDPDGAGTPNTATLTLDPGESNLDQDFGYQPPPGSIGDRIWRDDNGDGFQDPGEPGLVGIIVQLTPPAGVDIGGGGDGLPITTTTDHYGNYLFDEVPVGTGYVVTVINPPAGWTNTGGPDDDGDDEAALDIASGEFNMEQDFGYRPPAGLVGDTIFHDENGNGIQDPLEPGLPGINVTLTDGTTTWTTTTGPNGDYLFTGVPLGDYTITVDDPPPGWFNTGDPDGGNDSTANFTLDEDNPSNLNMDFGYQQPGKIGDFIWADLDGDGVQDPGEPGLPGIIVQLTPPPDVDLGTGLGNPITTMTDPDGKYEFPGLPPGEYTVEVLNPPPGWPNTGFPLGGGDSTATVTLEPGESRDDLDFGYNPPPGTIGDRIWRDDDGDGVQDPGEPGLPGITVQVTDGTNTWTTTTDPYGFYQFNGLEPGDYTVTVLNPPPGTNTGDPNDPPGSGDSTSTVTLPQDGVNLDQDFGYQPEPGQVGDTIYIDYNGNGIQDPGEPGMPGIEVTLTDGTNTWSTTTDANGNYLIEGVPLGDYTITVDNPPAWLNSGDPDGGNDSTSTFTLTEGEPSNLNQDFGYEPPGAIIGDRIWADLDGDGIQDPGEPGIPGIIVQLTPPPDVNLGTGPGNPITTMTDPNGNYLFTDVPPGEYTVEVLNPPPGWPNTGDPDDPPGSGDSKSTVTVTEDGVFVDEDFGYNPPPGTIGDRIWRDDDGDGVQDPGEPGLPGITVQVTDGTNTWTTTTDPYGFYQFNGLEPGDYTVTVLNPPPGTNTGDPDGDTPNTSTVTLPQDGVNLDQDFGYQPVPGQIGDTIYIDYNGNGIQDPGEPGMPGISVTLDGPGGPVTKITDANGNYLFENMPLGDYTITVDNPPAGWFNSGDPDGGNNSVSAFTLTEGEPSNLNQDFGYEPPGAVIGDRIWRDDNGDGVQDPGEPGLPGVTVTLTPLDGQDAGNGPGVPVTTTTDANGNYLFVGLPPGGYTVTVSNAPGTNTGDPDGVKDGTTTITLAEGEVNVDQDFGFRPTIILTPSYLVTRVVEGQLTGVGSKACYWITLSSQPEGNVVIDVDPSKLLKEVKIDKSQITLTPSNWNNLTTANQSNFLCVRAIDDKVDEPDDNICGDKSADMISNVAPPTNECGDHKEFVEHKVNAGLTTDSAYDTQTTWENRTLTHLGRPAENYLEAMVVDNDMAEVLITESFAITHLNEGGSPVGKACYWLTLGSQPLNPVTISITPDGSEVTTDKTSVTLNDGNWNKIDASLANKTNMVCVTPIDENVIDPANVNCWTGSNTMLGQAGSGPEEVCSTHMGSIGHSVSSTDPKYNPAPFRNTNGPDFDNDQSTIDALILNDDVARLLFQPATLNLLEGTQSKFNVSLASKPTADVFVSKENDARVLVFNPENWKVGQEIVVDAPSLTGSTPETLFFQYNVQSADQNFQNLASQPVEVTVIPENGVFLSNTDIRVSESSGSSSYDLVLTSQPNADVEVRLTTDGQLTVTPATLTFTPGNWNLSQRVTVRAVDDKVAEGAHQGRITHAVVSADAKYQGVAITDVVVEISDNDTAAVVASRTTLEVSEDGGQVTYNVTLQSQPTSTVVVRIDGGGQVTATPGMVTFTPANWNTPQAVQVQAVDDDVDEGGASHTAALSHKAESADPFYNRYESIIGVTVADNDVAGIVLSQAVLSVAHGGTATYTVVLTSRPTSGVVIDLAAGGDVMATNAGCTDAHGGNSCVLFTPDNWNVPQTVTVRSNGAGEITHVVSSADAIYAALSTSMVRVNSAFMLFMPVSRGN